MAKPDQPTLEKIIKNALTEDIGDGDHTSLACIPTDATGNAHLLVKESGIIAGIELAEIAFDIVDKGLIFEKKIHDGEEVNIGDVAFSITGKSQSILKAERVTLNFMQRMSGIASFTNRMVKGLEGTKTNLLDTRKTTPGLRAIEKWAVEIGGGMNHRHGLYDMIMIKDNHIDYAGGIAKAVTKTKEYLANNAKQLKIEVEARNMAEVQQIITVGGVHRIMLDNFTFEETKDAVALVNGQMEIESSGNITLETAVKYAACGVDYISVGALTHSVKSMDLSLKAVH